MDSWLNVITAALGMLTALIILAQYFNFRTKRDRHAEIGRAFAGVVVGLASASTIERLANAALLRRFWDVSLASTRDLPYAEDAVKVAAAILKQEPTGPVQKLLADELRFAPKLKGRSYQKANLRGAYWGANPALAEEPIELNGVDFFRADLSLCSLRGAQLQGAQFREAHLAETTFVDSDCAGANFEFANLRGAKFGGAKLSGAKFGGASHVPQSIVERLNEDGVFVADMASSPLAVPAIVAEFGIFISAPSVTNESDRMVLERLVSAVSAAGAVPRQRLPEDYGQTPPLEEITRQIAASNGVLVFGPTHLVVTRGLLNGGSSGERQVCSVRLPTPWNQVEAGIAVGLGKPVLVVSGGATGGVFDLQEEPDALKHLDLTRVGVLRKLDVEVAEWVRDLDPMRAGRQVG